MFVIKKKVCGVFAWALRKLLHLLKRFDTGDEIILQQISSKIDAKTLLKHSIAELTDKDSDSAKKIILQEVNSKISSTNILQYLIKDINDDELMPLSNVFLNVIPDDVIYKYLLPHIETEASMVIGDECDVGVNNGSNINNMCKAWIKNSLSIDISYSRIKPLLFDYSDIFSSQEGEDILLKRLMKGDYNNKGFYVDIGAFHPVRFSNTLHYYLRGWSGLNIDPTPAMKDYFDEVRPRDINVQAGISLESKVMEYHMFKEPAFNTFSKENKEYALSRTEYESSLKIQTSRLDDLFDKYIPDDTCIMFCTIDVEGLELDVLASNNWKKYRPNILLVENIDEVNIVHAVEDFVRKEGYLRVAQTKNTVFYMDLNYYETVK